jgi:hypothetical protein
VQLNYPAGVRGANIPTHIYKYLHITRYSVHTNTIKVLVCRGLANMPNHALQRRQRRNTLHLDFDLAGIVATAS